MRRIIYAVLTPVIVAAVLLGSLSVYAVGSAERITLEPVVYLGEESAARELWVTFRSDLGNSLFFESEYTFGGELFTEYRFSSLGEDDQIERGHYGFRMTSSFRAGVDLTSDKSELSGIELAYRELYEDTEIGAIGSRVIELSDYYDYYPINLSIDIPGVIWHGGYDDIFAFKSYYPFELTPTAEDQRRILSHFTEYFKIPVPDGIEYEITLRREEKDVSGVGIKSITRDYELTTRSTADGESCYFGFNTDYNGGEVDTSLIPGGRGIYKFDYTNGFGARTGIDYESLTILYPLEDGVELLSLNVSADGERLHAYTDNGGVTELLVIDKESGELLDTVNFDGGWLWCCIEGDGFIINFGKTATELFSVTDGVYERVLTVNPEKRQKEFLERALRGVYTSALDFSEDRLAIVSYPIDREADYLSATGFELMILDPSGISYHASYYSSLSTHRDWSDGTNNPSYTVRDPFDISWNN